MKETVKSMANVANVNGRKPIDMAKAVVINSKKMITGWMVDPDVGNKYIAELEKYTDEAT